MPQLHNSACPSHAVLQRASQESTEQLTHNLIDERVALAHRWLCVPMGERLDNFAGVGQRGSDSLLYQVSCN